VSGYCYGRTTGPDRRCARPVVLDYHAPHLSLPSRGSRMGLHYKHTALAHIIMYVISVPLQ